MNAHEGGGGGWGLIFIEILRSKFDHYGFSWRLRRRLRLDPYWEFKEKVWSIWALMMVEEEVEAWSQLKFQGQVWSLWALMMVEEEVEGWSFFVFWNSLNKKKDIFSYNSSRPAQLRNEFQLVWTSYQINTFRSGLNSYSLSQQLAWAPRARRGKLLTNHQWEIWHVGIRWKGVFMRNLNMKSV